jgi:DNA-binding CsgD family transcriptional regulator
MASVTRLCGRQRECAVLDGQLRQVRAGRSAVLVLRGEPGVGKTALLEYVAGQARDCRLARGAGVQSEMELAFAGLHQLLAPMLDRAEHLPAPQRDALLSAFGLRDGGAPDHFLVALAVLSLLAEEAADRPLVCLVDDAQWLDHASAQALTFAARRLLAEPVAMVFAVREPSDAGELDGLPALAVEGIGDDDARCLLTAGVRGRIDERVRDRIVAETRGNPLALLELPRGLTPAELAGGFRIPTSSSLSLRIEQSFLRRFASLEPQSQRLLLTAAAEPVGDITLLWRAAERLGIGADAAEPAESAGLIELGARVRFRHPLVRSAVYGAAALHDRREAHRALAEATDPEAEPDRRAWHRAHAASGLDECVAAELERSADRAQTRGGIAAAAAFLERAAELTPDPARRGARTVAAAQAKLEAGAPETAEALLATAELAPLDRLHRARAQRLRAELTFALRRGGDAPPLLLAAAERLVPLDPGLARDTYIEAHAAVLVTGHPSDGWDVRDVACAPPVTADPPGPVDLLLRGLATWVAEGYAAAAPSLHAALAAFRRDGGGGAGTDRWLWLACRVAGDLWDLDSCRELAARAVQRARDAGALGLLPLANHYLSGVHFHAGEYDAATALIEEAVAITEATGTAPLIQTSPLYAAYRGDEAAATALIGAGLRDAVERDEGMSVSMVRSAAATLCNGLGRYQEALDAAELACSNREFGLYTDALVELVEAAVRCDRPETAVAALDRLAERARASGTDWALGLEARSRALISGGPAAEALYEEAVERLTHARVPPYAARAQLVYGEWLRREQRRVEARAQLRAAHETFGAIGAEAFAERARRELLATGETARRRTLDTRDLLTPQESQIARLAADGHSNPEIAAQLFLSPRTVEYHLGKVYPKLNIGSRRELRAALAGAAPV